MVEVSHSYRYFWGFFLSILFTNHDKVYVYGGSDLPMNLSDEVGPIIKNDKDVIILGDDRAVGKQGICA